MSLHVRGGNTFAVTTEGTAFGPGLVGVLGVTVYDPDGTIDVVRTTLNIVELGTRTGLYMLQLVAPSASGQYTLVVDDLARTYQVSDIVVVGVVTSGVLEVSGSGSVGVSGATKIRPSGVLAVVGVADIFASTGAIIDSGVLNVSTNVEDVLVLGSIRLTVEAGPSLGGRPSVDATALRNFPRHRDNFGRRR